MVFFDLSILYQDPEAAPSAKHAEAAKAARLKAVVKAMELGYTGVAYDHHISGFMSDHDRCTIAPFPLSSLLKVAPGLSASVRFHRELLGVPLSAPFRQYRRLTVAVESATQAAALNSGNPVLKTYDLVAVRPLSQVAFDLACKTSEVHLITIDFSQKLPFRLKSQMPNVQDAIKRGIYFEVCYSHLIVSAQSRRQMLSSAKLLAECTRGKNVIFSSGAASADQIRGPYDVANLSSLFGFSIERAKTSISRTCRSLLISAFRKKQFFMGTIKVEKITPKDQRKNDEERLDGWSCWDPISSGEGDLPPVCDIDILFTDAIKVPRDHVSADFVTVHDDQNKSLHGKNAGLFGSNMSLFSGSEIPYFFSAAKDAQSNEKPVNDDMCQHVVSEEGHREISDGTAVTFTPLEVTSFEDRSPGSKIETAFSNSNVTLFTDYEPPEPIYSGSGMVSESMGFSVACIPSDGCIGEKDNEMQEDQFIDISIMLNKASSSRGSTMSSDQNSVVLPHNTAVGEPILLPELPQTIPIACNATMDVCASAAAAFEDLDGQSPTACPIVVEDVEEFEVKGKEGVVSGRSVLERDGLTTLARQEENTVSVRKNQLCKQSGKAEVTRKLKRQPYQLPFKGLLKRTLFKKKGKAEVTRKLKCQPYQLPFKGLLKRTLFKKKGKLTKASQHRASLSGRK